MARASHAIKVNADLEDDNGEEVEECNVRPGMQGLTKYLISFQKNFTDQDNQAHFGDRRLSMRALTNNLFTNCMTLWYESMWTRQGRVYLLTY